MSAFGDPNVPQYQDESVELTRWIMASQEQKAAAPSPQSKPPQPASSDQSTQAQSGKPAKLISCVQCQQRKVKCNKESPCSHCTKSRLECIYRPPAPPRRGKRKHSEAGLLARLRRCEELLHGSGIQLDDDGNISGTDGNVEAASNHVKTLEVEAAANRGQTYANALIHASAGQFEDPSLPKTGSKSNGSAADRGDMVMEDGNPRYIESDLWDGIGVENVSQTRGPLNGQSQVVDEQRDWQSPQLYSSDQFRDGDFIFDTPGTRAVLSPLHPSVPDAGVLWHTFLENVNPLTKVIHVPTLEKEFAPATKDPPSIPDNLEALMFSIYLSAVLSMTPTQCEQAFGVSRSILASRYNTGARKAFVNAALLRSSDLKVLQAYIIWIISIRESYDPRSLWTLTGIALRLGQRLGLHRERALKNVSVFEAEMRRRAWWQIIILDSRAAELSGSGVSVFVNVFDTKVPRNLNDSDLDPAMTELPQDRAGSTEMIFTCLRYELGTFLRRQLPSPEVGLMSFRGTKDEEIDGLERLIEQKYLRFCDALYPLHYLTSIVARAACGTMRLITHRPCQYPDGGAGMPREEKEMLFNLSMKIVKYERLARETKPLSKFLWHVEAYFPWHAFIYILSALSKNEANKEDSTAAWDQIRHVHDEFPRLLNDTSRPLQAALGNLTLKAWEADGENYPVERKASKPGTPHSPQPDLAAQQPKPVPPFIAKLRAQRQPRSSNNPSSSVQSPLPQPLPPQQSQSSLAQTSVPYNIPGQVVPFSAPQTTPGSFPSSLDHLYYTSAMEPMTYDATDWEQWERLLADSHVQDWSTSLAIQAGMGLGSVPSPGLDMGRLDSMNEVAELSQKV